MRDIQEQFIACTRLSSSIHKWLRAVRSAEYSADGGYAQHIHTAVSAASKALLDTVTQVITMQSSLYRAGIKVPPLWGCYSIKCLPCKSSVCHVNQDSLQASLLQVPWDRMPHLKHYLRSAGPCKCMYTTYKPVTAWVIYVKQN